MSSTRWAWLTAYPGRVLTAVGVITALLVIPLLTMPPTSTASQEPDGEVFAARDLAAERFGSDVHGMFFTVEARDGNLLEPAVLRELHTNAAAVRDDPQLARRLATFTDPVTGAQATGLWTLADRVDAQLAATGGPGLADAAAARIDAAASALVDRVGRQALGLSVASTRGSDGTWTVPAVSETVLGDNDALGGGTASVTLGADDTVKEQFGRDVQTRLRGAQDGYQTWGVALDVNLTSGEQGQAAGPFIGLVVVAILLLVGLTYRSYWPVAIIGGALGALMVWLLGVANLLGFGEDQILSTIVPIALISFGVDFAFHAIGRYREERATGRGPRAALRVGMAGVLGALLLALASDVAAFLSNVISGIESIVQFGVAASLGLAAAFLLLGVATPTALALVDERVGRRHGVRARVASITGGAGAAGTAMGVVLLTVFVAPAAGVALLGAYLVAFVAVPVWLLGRRVPVAQDVPGAAMAADDRLGRVVGRAVLALADRRAVVLPVALMVTAVAAWFAVQVPTEFDVEDFFAADTDFVVGLDKLDEHVGAQGGEPATIVVAADLTRPGTLRAIDRFAKRVAALDTERFGRDDDGRVAVQRGVVDVVEAVVAEPVAAAAVADRSGVAITDDDADGLPDDRTQLAALYDTAAVEGVAADDPRDALRAGQVTEVLAVEDGTLTQLSVQIVGSRAVENVAEARDLLAPEVATLQRDLQDLDDDATAVLTGGPIVRQASLDAVARALQLSLPIAVLLCLAISGAWMRSLRFAVVSVVPILLVVTWLYAIMYALGFALNLVTATIGAISIGIGIDFGIHLVMRYREELAAVGDRRSALLSTGAGTGVALVASAVSSIIGFAVLAFAPMPLFASYGLLTALMIVMALVASLGVLPSLLLVVTGDRLRSPGDRAATRTARRRSVAAG